MGNNLPISRLSHILQHFTPQNYYTNKKNKLSRKQVYLGNHIRGKVPKKSSIYQYTTLIAFVPNPRKHERLLYLLVSE